MVYVRYSVFILLGVVILIFVLVGYDQFRLLQQEEVKQEKDFLIQTLEIKIQVIENQLNTIGFSLVSFYKNSEVVTTDEFNNFILGLINEVPDIKNVFFTENGMVIQSYPHQEFVGSSFQEIFPTYPITMQNTRLLATEYKISDNQKIIIFFPFGSILSGEHTIDGNYKLGLIDPQNPNQFLFKSSRVNGQYTLEPVEFTNKELDSAITIDKQTSMFDTKRQQSQRLHYLIWPEKLEHVGDVFSSTMFFSLGIAAIFVPVLLIRAERFRIKAEKHAKSLENVNKELRQIDEQKAIFSTMITHELKSPLMPILGYCKMLKKPNMIGKLNEEQLDAVDVIEKNIKRLQQLILDILDARKLDSGRLRFFKNRFSMKELIDELQRGYEKPLKQRQIKFSVRCNEEKSMLYSDKNRLLQVFNNLINNSIKAVSPKTGEIEVGINQKDSQINFYVKDNGIGIPKDKQKLLFTKFYQIDSSLTRKTEGSGLGLNICKGIVKGLGGNIWVDSTEGKGSTFYFNIPMNQPVNQNK